MLSRRTSVGAALILAALVAAPGGTVAQAEEEFEWTGRLNPGQLLQVKGVNGAIRALPATGPRAEVMAVKRGARSDLDAVRIEVVEHAGGVTVCAVYPGGDCRAGDGGRPSPGWRSSTEGVDVEVEFTVRVPAEAAFAGRTVNGAVSARDLSGDVKARTVNGAIDVRTAGSASAETVNGAIRAFVGSLRDSDASLGFRTVNGAITLGLPPGAGARIQAETLNGALETDFALTIQAGTIAGPRRIRGTIGEGGPTIELKTVNGSIHLTREG